MNYIKYTGLLALMLFIVSCKKKNNDNLADDTSKKEGLVLVKTITNDSHNISLYTESGNLYAGYNKIFLQIKNTNGSLVNDAEISWKVLMQMHNMRHSCPYSSINKVAGKTALYEGYVVFTMVATGKEDFWKLGIDYTIDGKAYTVESKIDVMPTGRKKVVRFKGSDNGKYVIAMIAPTAPKAAVNDMQAMVFKMSYDREDSPFQIVDGYTVKIDPRMKDMGNHGSPNNVDLKQSGADKIYYGKLNLTMTGYWTINLQLVDPTGVTVKGDPVTKEKEVSEIFFEIEF